MDSHLGKLYFVAVKGSSSYIHGVGEKFNNLRKEHFCKRKKLTSNLPAIASPLRTIGLILILTKLLIPKFRNPVLTY